MWYGVKLQYIGKNQSALCHVSPYHSVYKNESLWCNYMSPILSWFSKKPLQLPPGMSFYHTLKVDHVAWEDLLY